MLDTTGEAVLFEQYYSLMLRHFNLANNYGSHYTKVTNEVGLMFDVLPNTPSVWSSFGKNTLSDADWNGRIRSPTGFGEFVIKNSQPLVSKNLRTSLRDASLLKMQMFSKLLVLLQLLDLN